jgi:glycosyltransferase involved in cell wall biosynthesis
MQTWSVGILCYNEAYTIEKVVLDTYRVLQQMTNTFEVIVVDDYSTDGSREIEMELQEKYPEVKVILHEVNKGIGAGLRSVYSNARYENVTVTSGDGQFDVTEYMQHPEISKDNFVSYYRKENTTYSVFRNILSLLNKKLNKIFIGINLKDVNWAKVYKKADIDRLDLQLTSSLVESEICAKLIYLGRKVIEVESKCLPRTHGESKGASSAIVKQAIKDIWKLIKIMRKFRRQNKKRVQ